MRYKTSIVAVAALALLAVTACSSNSTTSEAPAASGNAVAVTLDDYAIQPAVTTATPGEVTFTIDKAGATEMVVIQTDVAIADMAVEKHETDEEAAGMNPIGEVEGVQPGETTSLVLTLPAGNYVFLCNLPKHFERGMATEFQVA